MKISWFLFLVYATVVTGFDLGPTIRLAQCRSRCVRKHSIDGNCDLYAGLEETSCSMCWKYCETFENRWEESKEICFGNIFLHCPAIYTACVYRKTRVEEKYLPSMLPAPKKAPVDMNKFDVAVVMKKVSNQWEVSGYYPGRHALRLRPDTWIIVATEDGVKHYSWEEWVPKLEGLKEGPLYEATISWRDVRAQLQKQRALQQVRFNNQVRQFFLEKYGQKVLAEWRSTKDSQISDEVFRRFFFRRRDEHPQDLEADNTPSTGINDRIDDSEYRESYVVSWEPETGGLMGNQVPDSNSAQISLLPGTKYLVRIASNDGPGSFPIEVDTRPRSVQAKRIERIDAMYPWELYAAGACALALVVLLLGSLKVIRRVKNVHAEEV